MNHVKKNTARGRRCHGLTHFVLVLMVLAGTSELVAQQKAPAPDAQAQERSRKTAGEIYRDAFRQAKTAAEKANVAKEMCNTAIGIPDGSADQYVLLKIARDIAAGAGDAPTALQAVEVLVERFDVPVARLRGETLLTAARQATTTAQGRAVAEAAILVVDSLANAGEYDIALSLCDRARFCAENAQESALGDQLLARSERLKREQKDFQNYQDAIERLNSDPTEPSSNLAAGRYLCFVKGDWERGIAMLALGSDFALRAVAGQELRAANSPESQVSVGDVWWGLAEKETGEAKERIQQRAAHWYRQALPNLLGLTKIKAEKRLAETASHQVTPKAAVKDVQNGLGRGGLSSALAGRQEEAKKALLVAHGGTNATEEAVQRALEWLVKQQNTRTGLWSLQGPYADAGGYENILAATAMALLALQGAGNTHKAGAFQPNIAKGADALVKMQDQDGNFFREGGFNHRLYSQAQATIALCELYGMTKDPRYRQPAQMALDYASRIQAPQGGWRYVPKEDTDTSVTGWFVMAFQTGLMAGLTVRPQTLDGVRAYLDSATTDGSLYSYQAKGEPTLTMTAEAMVCRQYLGWTHDDPRLRTAVDLLLANPITFDEQDVYYWYYATHVLHHMGEGDWDKWNKIMRQAVPEHQVKDGKERGSWDPTKDRWGNHGGRLYTTCLSCLVLEVYYRHLSIYKLDAPAD